MKKRFNTTGTCIPQKHYMVNIDNKVFQIENMIDNGDYFVINRPRQYGKTTLISRLSKDIESKYLVLRTSFEGNGDAMFQSEEVFSKEILDSLADNLEFVDEEKSMELRELSKELMNLKQVSKAISRFVKNSSKEVVLIIDEVDKFSNNQLFLSFLGMLRSKFLMAREGLDYTFYSVILAGVYDIKNLKLKFREDTEIRYNSPWNIAVNFDVDMSFNELEIGTMLYEYAKENELELNIEALSKEIYKFTGGYPFLVSRVCQIVDEVILKECKREWNIKDIQRAVKIIINEKNTLFDDLIKNMENNNKLYELIYKLLISNENIVFNINSPIIELGHMFGYLKPSNDNSVVVSNQIIKEVIYNYMIQKNSFSDMGGYNFKDNFITEDNGLDMNKILLKFQQFMKENNSKRNIEFLEKQGVLLFLAFIKPIINGVGFDYKEVQVSEEKRLDIVIQYNRYKYIVEAKIWYGDVAHEKGLKQLSNYLDIEALNKGYLLIFNFNKNKEYLSREYNFEEKEIFEVIV